MLEIYSFTFYEQNLVIWDHWCVCIFKSDVYWKNKKQQQQQQGRSGQNRLHGHVHVTWLSRESLLPWLSAHTSSASTESRCCPCSLWHSPAGSRKAWAEWRAALWRSGRCRAAGTHADGPRLPSRKPPVNMKQRRLELDIRGAEKGNRKCACFTSFYIFLPQVTYYSWKSADSGRWYLRAKHLVKHVVLGFRLSRCQSNPVDRPMCLGEWKLGCHNRKILKSWIISIGRQQQACTSSPVQTAEGTEAHWGFQSCAHLSRSKNCFFH